jgi:hypothetical protein
MRTQSGAAAAAVSVEASAVAVAVSGAEPPSDAQAPTKVASPKPAGQLKGAAPRDGVLEIGHDGSFPAGSKSGLSRG